MKIKVHVRNYWTRINSNWFPLVIFLFIYQHKNTDALYNITLLNFEFTFITYGK
jgi:hypothetical protein